MKRRERTKWANIVSEKVENRVQKISLELVYGRGVIHLCVCRTVRLCIFAADNVEYLLNRWTNLGKIFSAY